MARDVRPFSAQADVIKSVPESILVVGTGIFGLSTFAHLLTLPRYGQTSITLLDTHLPSLESPTDLPTQNPHAASIDSSRIVRPDYANPSYARLAISAQEKWREGYGECLSSGQNETIYVGIRGTGEILKCEDKTCAHGPVYRESGMILTGTAGGTEYVRKAKENAEALGLDVDGLEGSDAIAALLKTRSRSSRPDIEGWIEGRDDEIRPGDYQRRDACASYGLTSRLEKSKENDKATVLGETGYINHSSGCVDNGRAMVNIMTCCVAFARHRNRQLKNERGKITFVREKASHILFSPYPAHPPTVTGVTLTTGQNLTADLTILATGAYTPELLDLRGRAEARGQAMAYIPLHPSEAHALRSMPVLLNIGTGMFAIPPVLVSSPPIDPNKSPKKQWTLKIARHAYGYSNPTAVTIATPGNIRKEITASIPAPQYSPIPTEASLACRTFLRTVIPSLASRPFSSTRLCWYTDTPVGDFLIDFHPEYKGLFLATGGSGHAFKFLPVLGEKIVDKIEGRLEAGLEGLWKWPDKACVPFDGTEDGSRSGSRCAVLGHEWAGGASKL